MALSSIPWARIGQHLNKRWPIYAFAPPALATAAGTTLTAFDPARQAAMRQAASEAATRTMLHEMLPGGAKFGEQLQGTVGDAVKDATGAIPKGMEAAAKQHFGTALDWMKKNPGQSAGLAALAVGVPIGLHQLANWAFDYNDDAKRLKRSQNRLQAAMADAQRRGMTVTLPDLQQDLKSQMPEETMQKVAGWKPGMRLPLRQLTTWPAMLGIGTMGVPAAALGYRATKAVATPGTLANTLAAEPAVAADMISDAGAKAIDRTVSSDWVKDRVGSALDAAARYPIDHPGMSAALIGGTALSTWAANKLYHWMAKSKEQKARDEAMKSLMKTAGLIPALTRAVSYIHPSIKSALGHGVAGAAGTKAMSELIAKARGDDPSTQYYNSWKTPAAWAALGAFRGLKPHSAIDLNRPLTMLERGMNTLHGAGLGLSGAEAVRGSINDVTGRANSTYLSGASLPIAALTAAAHGLPMRQILRTAGVGTGLGMGTYSLFNPTGAAALTGTVAGHAAPAFDAMTAGITKVDPKTLDVARASGLPYETTQQPASTLKDQIAARISDAEKRLPAKLTKRMGDTAEQQTGAAFDWVEKHRWPLAGGVAALASLPYLGNLLMSSGHKESEKTKAVLRELEDRKNRVDALHRKLAEAVESIAHLTDTKDGVKPLSDIVKPAMPDAPAPTAAHNETEPDANATDKAAPAREELKDAVADNVVEDQHWKTRKEQDDARREIADDTAPLLSTKDMETSDAAPAAAPAAPTGGDAGAANEPSTPPKAGVDDKPKAVEDPKPAAGVAAEAAPAPEATGATHEALDALKAKMEEIIALKPKIDAVHALTKQLVDITEAKADPKPADLVNAQMTQVLSKKEVPNDEKPKGPPTSGDSPLKGGAGDGLPDSAFDPKKLERGAEEEREHTSDLYIAKQIAKDQLTVEPDAYDDEEQSKNDEAKQLLGKFDIKGKKLLGHYDAKPVYAVDGAEVRQHLVDFIGGGNPMAYPTMPDEIWVEKRDDPIDAAEILVHEIIEYTRMRYGGEDYEVAHDRANEFEAIMRGVVGIHPSKHREIVDGFRQKLADKKMKKKASITLLTGAPGSGKTTAAKKAKNFDVVIHGDFPFEQTAEARRKIIKAKLREVMRNHNMAKSVLFDSAPRQLEKYYPPLLRSANKIIHLQVPEDVAVDSFVRRSKAPEAAGKRAYQRAGEAMDRLGQDPRIVVADRDTVGAHLKTAGSADEVHVIEFKANGTALNEALKLVQLMQRLTGWGSSREIAVKDAPAKDMSVFIDGDGPDRITDVKVDGKAAKALPKSAAAADLPFRRRVEVLITDGLNVFCALKPPTKGGAWFPGGGVEGRDEKFADAVARETAEEAGVKLDEIHRLSDIDPVECVWAKDAFDADADPKWIERAKAWKGDRTFFYVATAKSEGKAKDAELNGKWEPMKTVLSKLFAALPYSNGGWKPLTKARYRALLEVMPKTHAAPRAKDAA